MAGPPGHRLDRSSTARSTARRSASCSTPAPSRPRCCASDRRPLSASSAYDAQGTRVIAHRRRRRSPSRCCSTSSRSVTAVRSERGGCWSPANAITVATSPSSSARTSFVTLDGRVRSRARRRAAVPGEGLPTARSLAYWSRRRRRPRSDLETDTTLRARRSACRGRDQRPPLPRASSTPAPSARCSRSRRPHRSASRPRRQASLPRVASMGGGDKVIETWIGPFESFRIGDEVIRDPQAPFRRRVEVFEVRRGSEPRAPRDGACGPAPGRRFPARASRDGRARPAQALLRLRGRYGVPGRSVEAVRSRACAATPNRRPMREATS